MLGGSCEIRIVACVSVSVCVLGGGGGRECVGVWD